MTIHTPGRSPEPVLMLVDGQAVLVTDRTIRATQGDLIHFFWGQHRADLPRSGRPDLSIVDSALAARQRDCTVVPANTGKEARNSRKALRRLKIHAKGDE